MRADLSHEVGRSPAGMVVPRIVTARVVVRVLMCYAAANRDHEVYGPDADSLDVTRRPARILTFSHGAHHCLGAAAARMMGRVALEELLTRIPDFSVDLDAVRWAPGSYVRRPTTVPLEVH